MVDNSTKKTIREEAVALFKKNGYDQVTIMDICKASKISKNTFYYYFESKENLLDHLAKPSTKLDSDVLIKIMDIKSPYEKYMELTNVILKNFTDYGPEITKKIFMRVLSINLYEKKESVEEQSTDNSRMQLCLKLIQQAQDAKEIRNTKNPKKILDACWASMIGVLTMWVALDGNFDVEKKAKEDIDTIMMRKK